MFKLKQDYFSRLFTDRGEAQVSDEPHLWLRHMETCTKHLFCFMFSATATTPYILVEIKGFSGGLSYLHHIIGKSFERTLFLPPCHVQIKVNEKAKGKPNALF